MCWFWASLILVAAEASSGQSPDSTKADERLLLSKNVKIDDAGLLQFFRDRTLSKTQIDDLARKVKELGSVAYKDRKQAMADLIRMGPSARPFLLQVVKEKREPLETIRRVELCLRTFPEDEVEVAAAAVRVLGRRNHPATAEVLLKYLPFAVPEANEEIRKTLGALALKNKGVQELLLQASRGTHGRKRGIAAAALIQSGAKVPSLDKLLNDSDPHVRFQVASSLLKMKKKEAIPVLIDLIPALPADEVWQVEDLLARVAGSKGPNVYVDPQNKPAQVRDAWNGWWRDNQRSLDLSSKEFASSTMGYTLITQMDAKGTTGRAFEIRPDKEISWSIDGLRYPLDAQVIGNNRVLIAEYFNRRVSERDFKGKILWEKQVDMPISCQRLANGQTFIATRRQLLIVEPDGKEVFTYFQQNTSITAARRLRNGDMVLVTSGGMLQRLDPKGRVIKTFQVGSVYPLGGAIDVLANGHVLVPRYRDNRVTEFDGEGKVVWETTVSLPTSVVELPNGHILVVSMALRQVVELTRAGREVWSYKTDGRPWRAWKR
jgi:hypothetical protein